MGPYDPKDPRQDPTSVPPTSGVPAPMLTVSFNEAVLRALADLKEGQVKHDTKIDGLTEHDRRQSSALAAVQASQTELTRQVGALDQRITRAQSDATKALAKSTDTRDMIESTVAAVQASTNGLAVKTEAVAVETIKQTTSLSNLQAVNADQSTRLATTANKVDQAAVKLDKQAAVLDTLRANMPAMLTLAGLIAGIVGKLLELLITKSLGH